MHNVSILQNVVFNLILQKWSFDPHRNYCFAGELTQMYCICGTCASWGIRIHSISLAGGLWHQTHGNNVANEDPEVDVLYRLYPFYPYWNIIRRPLLTGRGTRRRRLSERQEEEHKEGRKGGREPESRGKSTKTEQTIKLRVENRTPKNARQPAARARNQRKCPNTATWLQHIPN